MVVASALTLSIPLRAVGSGLLLAPLLFYVIYVEDRRSVSDEDWINNPLRTRLIQRYHDELLGTEIVAFVGYELLLVFTLSVTPGRGIGYFLLGQLPFVVLALYGSLKQYPTFDSLAVGGTWAFVIVFSLLVSTPYVVSTDLLPVFFGWFLIVFAGVESRNTLDLKGDTAVNRTTLAGYLGTQATLRMERILKAIGVGIFWYYGSIWVAGIVLGYLILLSLFRTVTRGQDDRIGVIEGQMATE
jgi:1,4-dihydroxy-2-naphthoate octaprenyltransferase